MMKYKLAFWILGAGLIIAFGLHLYNRIEQSGYQRCEAKHALEAKKVNDKIITRKKEAKHETQSLDRAGIVRELCARGWVRERKGCPD